jgi:hypothetical protein
MNATTIRLNNMTVKALREIGRQIGMAGLSGCRKAELVSALTTWIDGCHIDAIRMNDARNRKPAVALNDFPAVDYRPITEAHVKICADRGHASYVINNVDQGFCPRCGDFTPEYLAKAIEQEKALAEIEPFDSPIALCGDDTESVSTGIVIAPVEIQIPAMVGPYGFTAHGNTYSVDYNRIHESMSRVPFAVAANEGTENGSKDVDFTEIVSAPKPLDIVSFLTSAHATLTALAEQAKQAENDAWDRGDWIAEEWTTVAKDLASAVANAEWSLNYRASMSVHTCSTWERETGLSGCAYGCKIYTCEKCGTSREIHNATYGCKG